LHAWWYGGGEEQQLMQMPRLYRQTDL
jgi:hypothetical protein